MGIYNPWLGQHALGSSACGISFSRGSGAPPAARIRRPPLRAALAVFASPGALPALDSAASAAASTASASNSPSPPPRAHPRRSASAAASSCAAISSSARSSSDSSYSPPPPVHRH